ncbi:MAG: SIS domain-containing protein [Candidatus Brocadiia bacterium]
MSEFPDQPLRDDLAEKVRDAILCSAEIKKCLAQRASGDVADAVRLVTKCLRAGGKVLLCGNGGSAAEAQHICAELVGRFHRERGALAAVALTTNTSNLTSIANDYSFEQVFSRQVEALGARGDVVFAYSTSGSSPNVLRAIEVARQRGLRVVGFTGAGGGAMAEACDVCIQAPSDDTPTIQECHNVAGHAICLLVEEALCGEGAASEQ